MTTHEKLEEVKEKLAAIEHERWADWQQWVHDSALFVEYDGKLDHLKIPAKQFRHWDKQIKTKYQDLPEHSKQSDRDQVDRYWSLILALINQASKEAAIEELEWADNKFDSLLQATEDGDRVHPGEYYEAIEARIKALKEGK